MGKVVPKTRELRNLILTMKRKRRGGITRHKRKTDLRYDSGSLRKR